MRRLSLLLGLLTLSHGTAAGFIGTPEQIGVSQLCQRYRCSPAERTEFMTEWGVPMTSVRFIVPTLKLRVELGIDKKGMSRYAEAEVQSQKPTATQIAYFIEMIRVGSGKSVSQASLKACFEKASRQPLDARSAGLGDESSPGVVCITGTSQKPLFKVAVFEGNPH